MIIPVTYNELKYTTIIYHAVLSGCETYSLTLKEEHNLRLFEDKLL